MRAIAGDAIPASDNQRALQVALSGIDFRDDGRRAP
jgi:hypothetical protein